MLFRNGRLGAAVLLPFLLLCACGKKETAETPNSRPEAKPVPDEYKVKFETTKGDFTVEVNKSWAPVGAERFHELATSGFFDGAKFFRVLPGFVVQFGLAAEPELSAKYRGARMSDDPVIESNAKGTITFATSGPNSRTSQVFINLADNPRLDQMGFAPFGKVVEGMNVVESLYSGYGEGAPHGNGPDQSRIQSMGNKYLDASFPNLDGIKKATVVE